jgi:hypothetical protein
MTPDDLAKLLQWLYGDAEGRRFLAAAARDLRINERNLRGMMGGKVVIPPIVSHVVCALTVAHAVLHGWLEHATALETMDLTADTRAELEAWRRMFQ